MNLEEFFAMSGYGAYVWSCYGLTVAVLVGNAWAAKRRLADSVTHAKRRAQIAQGGT